MERFFQLLAVALAGVAAYFLFLGRPDAAFVTAVLGSVSFFLSIRFPMKERNKAREAESEATPDRDEFEDASSSDH